MNEGPYKLERTLHATYISAPWNDMVIMFNSYEEEQSADEILDLLNDAYARGKAAQ